MTERVYMERNILQGNQAIAQENRNLLKKESILTMNVLSSPGAGKTTFLEKLLPKIKERFNVAVIEGDVATTLDSERIAAHGVHAVQINTHGACHLDAKMISGALKHFDLANFDMLIIENVGNLVCPAEFDLGEDLRIVLLSTTEGLDKVVKYPVAFRRADAVILNKIDLLPYLSFDVHQFKADVQRLNPNAPIFLISAVSGEGMEEWINWLQGKMEKV